jgi:hypothetical protein
MKEEDNSYLDELYGELTELAGEKIGDGIPVEEVSALFIRIGLEIYRTANTEEEFNNMIDYLSENRHHISSLDTGSGHLH